MKFRKKPVVVEAAQWLGYLNRLPAWANAARTSYSAHKDDVTTAIVYFKTLEGEMRCDYGDWVILGIKGEVYPCKPDIFEASYEKVEE